MGIGFVVLILVLLTSVCSAWLLYKAEDFLIVKEAPQQADCIVVLAGSEIEKRLVYGVELYQRGYAQKLLMCGGTFYWETTGASQMKLHAQACGVPPEAILLEDQSKSTYEDAQMSLPILLQHGIRSIILVSSPYHTRRARMLFEQAFRNSNIDLRVCSYETELQEKDVWWHDVKKAPVIVQEYLKLLWHFLYGRKEQA